MTSHDPLCVIRWSNGCDCQLIAKVRADEQRRTREVPDGPDAG